MNRLNAFVIAVAFALMIPIHASATMPSSCALRLVGSEFEPSLDFVVCVELTNPIQTVAAGATIGMIPIGKVGAVVLTDTEGNRQTVPTAWMNGEQPCDVWNAVEAIFPICEESALIPPTDFGPIVGVPNEDRQFCLAEAAISVDRNGDGERDDYFAAGVVLDEGPC